MGITGTPFPPFPVGCEGAEQRLTKEEYDAETGAEAREKGHQVVFV